MENKWKAMGQAFENLGMELRVECENMESNCLEDSKFERLWGHYVQMLETIKINRTVISNLFEELDEIPF